MSILEVKDLYKNFGKTQVLRGISFSMEQGEVLSIIGSSGSGKTTLLRCLTNLERADKGVITVGNKVVFDPEQGVKLTKEYCEQLKKAELDSMQITFYSHEEAVHNQLVGADNYEKTLEGIKNALAAGINISINTPLCKKNKDYVETLKFLKSLGVEYVTCSGLITTGNATTEASVDLQLTKEEIKEVLKTAVEYCFNNGMEISFTSPGWIEEAFFQELAINIPSCGACLSNMAVTPGGNVVPCQSWLTGDVLGNILEDKWEDIWNSDACVKRREYSADMTGKCPLRRE